HQLSAFKFKFWVKSASITLSHNVTCFSLEMIIHHLLIRWPNSLCHYTSKWNSGNSTLLAGQTWSTMMDMNAYPSMVLEPTITGVVFTRQPMLRFSQDFGAFKYDLAIEQGKDAIKQTGVPGEVKGTVNTPDLILGLETNTELFWLRATGVVNQIKAKRGEEERLNELGYGFQVSGGLKITDKDFWNVSYFNSHGHDRYVLGSNGTSSQVTGSGLDVEKSQAIWTSIGHTWSENVKSTIGYGAWKSDTPELSQMTELTESQFALANVKYTVRENLTLGAEYNYTKATTAQKPTKDNHRLILAIDYQF
ncbi:hypothetical protein BCU27_24585, partial [Vibrio sp. 10N.286.45.B6]